MLLPYCARSRRDINDTSKRMIIDTVGHCARLVSGIAPNLHCLYF